MASDGAVTNIDEDDDDDDDDVDDDWATDNARI